MLLARNATVTVCHTRTADMPAVCREGELLIVSAGRAGMIDKSYLSPGQIVIDVGINVKEDGSLCGGRELCRCGSRSWRGDTRSRRRGNSHHHSTYQTRCGSGNAANAERLILKNRASGSA